ncbi:hypothetical protein VYU27_006630 [Nannochloropsis oceanica]
MSTGTAKTKKKRQWMTSTQAAAVAAAFEAWAGDWRQPGDKDREIDALAAALSLPPRTIKKRFTYLHQKNKKYIAAKENKTEKTLDKKREWLTPGQAQEIAAAFEEWGGVWEEREEEVARLATSLGLEKRKVKKHCAYLRSKKKERGGAAGEEGKEGAGLSLPSLPLLSPLLPPPPSPSCVARSSLTEVRLQAVEVDNEDSVHVYI